MSEAIVEALQILLPAVATVLAAFLVQWVRSRIGVEGMKKVESELQSKKELVRAAVRFVEQTYFELDGPQKYRAAVDWLVATGGKYGFDFEAEELKGLIESILREFKDEFGESWAKEVED